MQLLPFAAQLSATTAAETAPADGWSTPISTTTPAPARSRRSQPERDIAVATPQPKRVEIELGLVFAGGGSSWTGDGIGYGGINIGVRILGLFTPYFGGALGYGRVDQRLLTRLTIGIAFGVTLADRFRPYVFAAGVHQHEESLAVVSDQPFGAVFGIGTGIRHRAGGDFGIGIEITAVRRAGWDLTVAPEASVMSLSYSSGPDYSYLGGITVRGHFRIL